MKKYYIILFALILLFNSDILAQRNQHRGDGRGRERMMELEKVKLLEELNLTEENSVRFITRLKEHRNKMFELQNQQNELTEKMESELNDKEANYKKFIDNFLDTEIRISKERENFIGSISDILTDAQIAKFIVFERKFRDEIRGVLMREKMRRNK